MTARHQLPSSGSPITRRNLLRAGTACVVGSGLAPKAAAVHLGRRPKLRVLGTHVTLQEIIRQRAEADLGIEIEFIPGGSAEVLQTASTYPEAFDIYEQWSNSIEILWQADAIQRIDSRRIQRWSEVNDLCKQGRLSPDDKIGAGASPHGMLYAQPDGQLGSRATDHLSFLPYVHNVDSFGYDRQIVPEGRPYEEESWSWLLDPQWKGKVAIVNEPTIGLFDLALACKSKGLVKIEDIGEITRPELDELFEVLAKFRRDGQFSGFWNSVPHSIELMRSGRSALSSMFSPAVATLNGEGRDILYAAPKEGYRAWHGVMCVSSQTKDETLDAAYKYMNWWLEGWPGALMARQGYYISTPDRSREFMGDGEWGYWYGGEETPKDLQGPDGRTSVRAGSTRRGGSYTERFGNVAVWNTVMDSYEYSLGRWYSLLAA